MIITRLIQIPVRIKIIVGIHTSFFYCISENLVEGLTSTGKRLSIALNSTPIQEPPASEENFSSTTSIQQTAAQQIDNTQQSSAQPSVQPTISTNEPKKKQHIMISYNRSCEDDCRKIRNSLKVNKYYIFDLINIFNRH